MYLLFKKYRFILSSLTPFTISTLNYFQIFNDNINLSKTVICVSTTNLRVLWSSRNRKAARRRIVFVGVNGNYQAGYLQGNETGNRFGFWQMRCVSGRSLVIITRIVGRVASIPCSANAICLCQIGNYVGRFLFRCPGSAWIDAIFV